jgi:hypothetical protein
MYQMNHRNVVFIYTRLVSRAPVQQQAETTAVYTKVHAHDGIVCEGVTDSIHERKKITAYSPEVHWHHEQQGVTITVINVTMLASICETLARPIMTLAP